MTDTKDHPALAIGLDLDELARRAGYARLPGEADAELRRRAFGHFSTVRWELGARVGRYRVLPGNEQECAATERLGCAEFEALSIGREGEGPQVAIIPLDESSRKIARHIVDLHNAAVVETGWRPMETAPRDGTDILVLVEDGPRRTRVVARWAENARGNGFYGNMGWMTPGYQGVALEAVSPPPVLWTALPDLPVA